MTCLWLGMFVLEFLAEIPERKREIEPFRMWNVINAFILPQFRKPNEPIQLCLKYYEQPNNACKMLKLGNTHLHSIHIKFDRILLFFFLLITANHSLWFKGTTFFLKTFPKNLKKNKKTNEEIMKQRRARSRARHTQIIMALIPIKKNTISFDLYSFRFEVVVWYTYIYFTARHIQTPEYEWLMSQRTINTFFWGTW